MPATAWGRRALMWVWTVSLRAISSTQPLEEEGRGNSMFSPAQVSNAKILRPDVDLIGEPDQEQTKP